MKPDASLHSSLLPRAAWRRVYRVTLFVACSVVCASAAAAEAKPPGYAIASAHPLATAAAAEILQAGGNAFDAAVAVSSTLSVVEPYSSGIGGGGFWLLHRASDGYETLLDGRETAPAASSATMYQDQSGHAIADLSRNGAIAGAIPGEPAALAVLAGKYGKLGLARDLQPAIRIAREGFAIDAHFAEFTAAEAARLSPAARAVFMPGGQAPAPGTLIRQPDLAYTLELMARDGAAGFYGGEVAKKLVAGVRADHGIWTLDDLSHYHAIEREPIRFWFRDQQVTTAPPPSGGGVGLAEMLQELEILGWTGAEPKTAVPQVIESMRRAYRDRAAYLGDPDYVQMPLAMLLSRSHAAQLAASVRPGKATPSASLPPTDVPQRPAHEGHETSHFSIIDRDGNRVSATVTVNLSFGSGYMAPGTGVIVNDEMDDFAASITDSNAYGLIGSRANEIAPGKRPLSSMAPSFVEGPDGVMITGTPGGSRITTMVLLSILDYVRGETALQIVSNPRYHHQYLPDVVEYEGDAFSPALLDTLGQQGYVLKPTSRRYGNLQTVIWRSKTDRLEAAADPRGVGNAVVQVQGAP